MGMKAEEILAIAIAKIKSGGGTGRGDMNKSDYDPNSVVREAGGIEEFVNGIGTNKANESTISRVENGNTASAKIDKDEQFYHNNVLYTATSDIAQGGNIVTSGTGQNCEVSPSVTSQIAQKADKSDLGTASAKNAISVVTDSTDLVESGAVKDIIGWGNKNLAPITLDILKSINVNGTWNGNKYTFNNVIFTVNDDLSISMSGTTSQATGFNLLPQEPIAFLDAGDYIMSGCPANGDFAKSYSLIFAPRPSGTHVYDEGDGLVINNTTANQGYNVYIYIRSGVNVTGKTFKPQLEKGSTATAYEPYHASVEESLAEKCDNTVIAPVENGSTASQAYAVGSHAIRNGKFITWVNAKAQGETINNASDYTSGDVADFIGDVINITANTPAELSKLHNGVNAVKINSGIQIGSLTTANNVRGTITVDYPNIVGIVMDYNLSNVYAISGYITTGLDSCKLISTV